MNCEKHGKLYHCIGCKLGLYCSHECQKAHWKEHKQVCKELAGDFKIVASQPEKCDVAALYMWVCFCFCAGCDILLTCQ